MKLLCSMSDEEFEQIKRHIQCREWHNPIEGEYIFYDPTQSFQLILNLFAIQTYTTGE
jgi:hypothetical protein